MKGQRQRDVRGAQPAWGPAHQHTTTGTARVAEGERIGADGGEDSPWAGVRQGTCVQTLELLTEAF